MKILVLSDIHSNIFALDAIWKQERDSDLIVCAGDLVDYGPNPKEVLDWIRAHPVTCVLGNHDQFLISCYWSGRTLEQVPAEERAWVHHNAALLDEDDILFLEQLPPTAVLDLDGFCYGMTHLYEGYKEIVSLNAFEQFRERTFDGAADSIMTRLILGHTHRQCIRYLSDATLWLNPGSVSYRRPDDPDQTAHYAIIADGTLSLRRLSYQLDPLRRLTQGAVLIESELAITERCFGFRDPAA